QEEGIRCIGRGLNFIHLNLLNFCYLKLVA
ncbi:MAG: hypothetical protein ACI9FN_003455, partial [Saprospiraceae bacterium]